MGVQQSSTMTVSTQKKVWLSSVKVDRTLSHKVECLIWNKSNKSLAFFSLRTFDTLYVIISKKKALSLKHFFSFLSCWVKTPGETNFTCWLPECSRKSWCYLEIRWEEFHSLDSILFFSMFIDHTYVIQISEVFIVI